MKMFQNIFAETEIETCVGGGVTEPVWWTFWGGDHENKNPALQSYLAIWKSYILTYAVSYLNWTSKYYTFFAICSEAEFRTFTVGKS
jgi:hypothetical protein